MKTINISYKEQSKIVCGWFQKTFRPDRLVWCQALVVSCVGLSEMRRTNHCLHLISYHLQKKTVSSFSVTAPLALFQRGLGGDRGDGGESNLAPHPAPDDPPLQQGEQSTAQGEATRDRQLSPRTREGSVRMACGGC
ncbi:hypothetical protein J6590_028742 [Homalodisca vitripennis]|nr:hypothetical protein J6590_028742 [Homalodisca vitripennis]